MLGPVLFGLHWCSGLCIMWKQVLIASALGVAVQLHADVLYAAAPSERGAFHVGTGSGTYNYGYNTGDGIAKIEVRRPDGSVVGSYRYVDANGKQVIRSYIADNMGFRVLGNDLPISPNTQATAIEGLSAFTAPVEGDTSAKYHNTGFNVNSNQQINEEAQNFVNHEAAAQKQTAVLQKQEALLKQQQELIQKQQQQIEQFKRQYQQQQSLSQKVVESVKYTPPAQPLYTRPIQNAISPYLLLPNKVNYDFPAGFALKGRPIVKKPIGVRGEHSYMMDYAAGHAPSAGHIHPPVGPHKETRIHYNQVTAGHTRSHPGRRGPFIIGHAR